jgi:hypothetical protein
MRRFLAYRFSSLASSVFAAGAALALSGCIDGIAEEMGDDVSCNLSIGFANGRSMDSGRGVVYGTPFAPVPDVLARGTVEDLRFSVPTQADTEDTLLEPTIAVEGDALAATSQSLSCATSQSALLDGRIEARAVGTAKIVVKAVDGVNDTISFEVREAKSLAITGPEAAMAGEQVYLAAELRDADERPLYASSSVSWTVIEGAATFPDADGEGHVSGAFALVQVDTSSRVVVQADAIGFRATLTIEPAEPGDDA